MNFEDWCKSVPDEIARDALWQASAYRYALFAGEIAWHDVTKLIQDKRTLALSDQLVRAIGSNRPIFLKGILAVLVELELDFTSTRLGQREKVAVGITPRGTLCPNQWPCTAFVC